MRFKIFLAKTKKFIKKNAYALTIGTCSMVALVLVMLIAIVSSSSPEVLNPPVVETVTPSAIIFTKPIEGADVSKEFANDKLLEDKTSGYWQTHEGIDIKAKEGTSVLAVFDGKVESVEKSMMEGTIIVLNHNNSLKTVYKCLSEDNVMVSVGQTVKKGEKIGEVGLSLKEKAEGSHLHFEVIENGKRINPTTYLVDEEGK